MQIDKPCPCCGFTDLEFIGNKHSILRSNQSFEYRYWYCKNCFYRFQGNPDTNFEELYNQDYYRGRGADKLVDYEFELIFPDQTVRNFEFAGILEVVESLRNHAITEKSDRSVNWLDFSCGNGAFVSYLNKITQYAASGYDIGFAANEGKKSGMNILEFENLQEKSFDVITAIEVLEHTDDPRAMIQLIHKLLKPGGLFFYTTGNSRPFSNNFLNWKYTLASDVHIGFFEPQTMSKLLKELGFKVQKSDNYSGWGNIYKYKILKNLKIKKRRLGLIVPKFSPIVKVLDRKFQLMDMPVGIRPEQ
jgi:SAM-dependent methyltransferase